jgi:hypothetical protein
MPSYPVAADLIGPQGNFALGPILAYKMQLLTVQSGTITNSPADRRHHSTPIE